MSSVDKVFAAMLGILFAFFLFIVVMKVTGQSCNADTARANVEKTYPLPAVVRPIPDNKFRFVVTFPDGSMRIIGCMNLWNDAISSDVVVVPPTSADPPWHADAVKAGKAEYYLDANHERQWRWLP